jgi:heme/copper-type cytochrome/quinol oxidase subunit 2
METRTLIAYVLIAMIVAGLAATVVYFHRKRAERRRIWQGRSHRHGG